MSAYKKMTHERFRTVIIREKSDIYNALKTLFAAKQGEVKPA